MIGSIQANNRKERIIQNMNLRLSGKMIKREEIENDDEYIVYDSDEDNSTIENSEDDTFYYFEDNLLSKSVVLTLDATIDFITIHLCIYKIDIEKYFPFLKYILKEEDNEYKFPEIKLTFSNLDDIEIYFKNEVIKNVMSIVNLYDKIDDNFVKKIYKGFIEDKSDYYVFIDITEYIPKLNKDYLFSIMDEIINVKNIREKKINNKVTDIFYQNKFMTYLKHTNTTKNIQYPIIGYNCIFNESSQNYENVIEKENDTDENEKDFFMIDHHLFGNNYYFTSESVKKQSAVLNFRDVFKTEEKEKEKLLRYALFIENPRYILRDIGNDASIIQKRKISNVDEEKNIYNIAEIDKDYSSLYFHENNIQFWAIKNVNSIAIV